MEAFLEESNLEGKINFVGYSLGGIVIRESLKYLKKFK